jgi:ADP-heptose:LPS heptosyltransferase
LSKLSLDQVRALGENQPADFFRLIVEPLADSFDPEQSAEYERLMRAWIPSPPQVTPGIPDRVDTVFVLSRVTLGADIKITSIILDAMKRRFPGASIVFVANRKSAELFAADRKITHVNADYPRSGPVSGRIAFAHELRQLLNTPHSIVIDPDSRMTQLGLIPICDPEHHFHFPSRTADWAENLTDLTKQWLTATFGQSGEAYIAPEPVTADGDRPMAAISLGVGENETKRIPGDFETRLIRDLGARFRTLWIDRGAGGEEARRVTAAAEASGVINRVRFREGSFAGFASIISQCDYYAGYDSAGQHAAAASGTPLVSYFAGAPSDRFRRRWAPSGCGAIEIIYS